MGLTKRAFRFAGFVLGLVGSAGGLIFGLLNPSTFGVAVILACVVALAFFGYILFNLINDIKEKLADYQSALTAAAEAREKLAEAQEKMDSVPEQLKEERLLGRLDAVGAFLAAESQAELDVRNMAIVGGALVVVATLKAGEYPPYGARFLLQSREMQTRRGIVVVDNVADDGSVVLTVREMEDGSGAFWDEAQRHASVTESTPGNLDLVPDPLLLEITERVEIQ